MAFISLINSDWQAVLAYFAMLILQMSFVAFIASMTCYEVL